MAIIKQAVLHIYDSNTGQAVLSEQGLDLTIEDIQKYIEAMIEKVSTSFKRKQGNFKGEESSFKALKATETDFIGQSQQLTQQLTEIMAHNPDIPPADWLWTLFLLEDGDTYLGAFKLNHNTFYTHFVNYEEEHLQNELILHRSILPSPKQAIDEGLVVNLKTGHYYLIEKKHVLEEKGQSCEYFSGLFLKISPQASVSEAIKEIKKAVEATAKFFDDPVYDSLAKAKEILYHEMSQEEGFSNERMADQLYKDNVGKKTTYMEKMSEVDLSELEDGQDAPLIPNKMQRQKLKLSNGIELTIPLDLFYDPNVVEWINNPDGTLSVHLKNIESIRNLF